MANRIIRLLSGSFGGVAISGVVSIEFTEDVTTRTGRSDAESGDTTNDIVGRSLAGSLLVADEDADLTLLTGTANKFVGTYTISGGATRTITIGATGKAPGIVFTGADTAYDFEGGAVPAIRLPFVGVYASTCTKTLTATIADVTTGGTALMSIA